MSGRLVPHPGSSHTIVTSAALTRRALTAPDKTKSVNRLLRKIENLGFEVTGIREKQADELRPAREVVSS